MGEEEGEGGGEGGANLHFLFLHQGRVFLILGGGGGGCLSSQRLSFSLALCY